MDPTIAVWNRLNEHTIPKAFSLSLRALVCDERLAHERDPTYTG